jgi:hypothetical protein
MTDWSYDPYDPIDTDRPSLSRKIFVRTLPAFAAFSFSALVALRLAGGLAEQAATPDQAPQPATTLALQAEALPVTAALKTGAAREGANPYGALFDQDGSLVGAPANTAMSEPVGPAFSPFQSQPLFVMVDPIDAPPQDASQQDASQQDALQQDAEADAPPQATEQASAAPTPPPAPQRQVAEAEPGVPVPPSRPSELTVQPRVAELSAPPRGLDNATPRKDAPRAPVSVRERAQATTLSQNDPRNFFEKLLGAGQDRNAQKGPQLAYASPDGGSFNPFRGATSSPSPVTASGGTAVYDIAAHTVYLPNGRALEAHSGLGPFFDDPGHVHVRMRGATPPAVYNLTLRESLFHGVQALRLTPVSGSTYGRNGLLAHTFMLGQRGDSNGCVSFRDYRAFLQAYMSGEVRRLVVVPRRS